MTGRIIAIGDIHGCSVALAAVVRAIGPTAFVGDLYQVLDHDPDHKDIIFSLAIPEFGQEN